MATHKEQAELVDLTGRLGIAVMKVMPSPDAPDSDFDFLIRARTELIFTRPEAIDTKRWRTRLEPIALRVGESLPNDWR